MSIKTDNSQTLVNALAEIESLRGRMSELESVLGSAWSSHCLEAVEWTGKAKDVLSRSDSAAWLLRKQAEAISISAIKFRKDGIRPEVSRPTVAVVDLEREAQRLRNQADELEGK